MPACVGSIIKRVWADRETWIFEVLDVFEEAGTDRPRYKIKMISVHATLFPRENLLAIKSVTVYPTPTVTGESESYKDTILLEYDSIIEHLKKLQKCQT